MFAPVEWFIGIRYIYARRGNHFIAFISLTAIVGEMHQLPRVLNRFIDHSENIVDSDSRRLCGLSSKAE